MEQLQVCLLSAILKTSSKKEREREREKGRKEERKEKKKGGKSNSFGLPYTGERNGKPLQYSYLENPMDRGAR